MLKGKLISQFSFVYNMWFSLQMTDNNISWLIILSSLFENTLNELCIIRVKTLCRTSDIRKRGKSAVRKSSGRAHASKSKISPNRRSWTGLVGHLNKGYNPQYLRYLKRIGNMVDCIKKLISPNLSREDTWFGKFGYIPCSSCFQSCQEQFFAYKPTIWLCFLTCRTFVLETNFMSWNDVKTFLYIVFPWQQEKKTCYLEAILSSNC